MTPKFRAWHKKEKKMFDVSMLVLEENEMQDKRVWYPDKAIFIPLTDVILLQSTGLFDKNKKEIWEGDIVRYNVTPSACRKRPKYLVYFSTITHGWHLKAIDKDGYASTGFVEWERTTKIGENPELLKEEEK